MHVTIVGVIRHARGDPQAFHRTSRGCDRDGLRRSARIALAAGWVGDHEVEAVGSELMARYTLNHQAGEDAEAVTISTMGPDMEIVDECTDLPPTTDAQVGGDTDEDGEWDGVPIHTVDPDEFPAWRLLWTAQDPYGRHSTGRRSHDPMRMLVANDHSGDFWAKYLFTYGSFPAGHSAGGCTDPGARHTDWHDLPESGPTPHGYYDAGAWVFSWYALERDPESIAFLVRHPHALVPAAMGMTYRPSGRNPQTGRAAAGAIDPIHTGEDTVLLETGSDLEDGREWACDAPGDAAGGSGREQCRDVVYRAWQHMSEACQGDFDRQLDRRESRKFGGDALMAEYSLGDYNCAHFADLVTFGERPETLLLGPRDLMHYYDARHPDGNAPFLMGVTYDFRPDGGILRRVCECAQCRRRLHGSGPSGGRVTERPDGEELWHLPGCP